MGFENEADQSFGRLRHSMNGGPSGQEGCALGCKDAQDRLDDGGFADAGPAGHDQHLADQGESITLRPFLVYGLMYVEDENAVNRRPLVGFFAWLLACANLALVWVLLCDISDPFGSDGNQRRHHRSPTVAASPAGQDPGRAKRPVSSSDTDAPFATEVQSFLPFDMWRRVEAAPGTRASTSIH
jgi:hypothetical protein